MFTMLCSEESPGGVFLMAIDLYRHVDMNRSKGHSCDVWSPIWKSTTR